MTALQIALGQLWVAGVTVATPTDTTYDPVDVTPGPVGFFATVALFLAVGVIAMGLMRRASRATARFEIREQLAREAAEDARAESTAPKDERE